MAYVTKQKLVDLFGADELAQLTDRFGDGDIDDDVLNAAIADAEQLANSYLAPRYTLPLDQALVDASPLPRRCADLVRYALMSGVPTDEARDRYKDAVAWLRDVQNNRASLGETDTAVATPEGRLVTGQGSSGIDWGGY